MKIVPIINNYKTQLLAFVMPLVLLIAHTDIQAAQTTRVSVSSSGGQGNGASSDPFVSPDARYLVFSSSATNLVAGDTNMYQDVFLRERLTGITTRVSLTSGGGQANGASMKASITPDGRYVVFSSSANNLVSGDTNGKTDVFVRDRTANTTIRVSVGSTGGQGNGDSSDGLITPDGRYILFVSSAANLVNGDTNGKSDIFVRDRVANTTARVSLTSAGGQSNNASYAGTITPDGRFVAFTSNANNLVSGDTNNAGDVFVRDRVSNTTTRVSVSSTGEQTNYGYGGAWGPSISADGRYVAFTAEFFMNFSGIGVYVRDKVANTTTQITFPEESIAKGISSDGRYVAAILGDITGDITPPQYKVYIYDKSNNKFTQINVSSTGGADNGDNITVGASISADGRFVGFDSDGDNLVTGDTNNTKDAFLRDRLVNTSLTADLQASMTVKPASIVKGQNGSYKVTIKNNSTITAQYVWLTDVISNGTLVVITPSAGTCSKAAISVCRIPSLGPGASATITLSIKANANPLSQLILLNAEPKDNVSSNNTLKVSTPVN